MMQTTADRLNFADFVSKRNEPKKSATYLNALRYLRECKFSVIPVGQDKRPLIKWLDYQKRLPTEAELLDWFTQWPDANIGIVTGVISNLAVIDLDEVDIAKAALDSLIPDSLTFPVSKTPSGGEHWFFSCTDTDLFNNAKIIPGADLRANGGYVVAPPSINAEGKPWSWLPALDVFSNKLPPLPDAYVEFIGRQGFSSNSTATGKKTIAEIKKEKITQGARNDTVTRLAGSYFQKGLGFDEVLALCISWSETHCEPILEESEIKTTVVSIYNKHENEEEEKQNQRYFMQDGFLSKIKITGDGAKSEKIIVKLCNFNAKITKEIIEDNGLDITHHYNISGSLGNGRPLSEIEIPASQFANLNWLHKWGVNATLEPGQSIKDCVRHAVQISSDNPERLHFYTHTGWREINGGWCYLSYGGAIGSSENIKVKLPKELQKYSLPQLPQNEREGIATSLSFLDIADRGITLPLWCLLYLAPLTTLLEPKPNFSGYIFGETGTKKTTLAILLLSHFGGFNSITNLQNFEDTANNLEKRSFTLKDTLMILDDLHPTQKKGDSETMEAKAQRLIRSYSNRTGRGRLNADTTDKGRYEPRGCLLITGEELVSLQSTLARIMVVEIDNSINLEKLTQLQYKAGLLPNAMTSYIQWVGANIQELQKTFPDKFIELRQKAHRDNIHAKLPEQTAFLQYTLDLVLSWLVDKNIYTEAQAQDLSSEGWNIFINLAAKHSQRIEGEDPIKKFLEILTTMIQQGKVKIEPKNDPLGKSLGGESSELIGWYDDLYYYFIPQALWHSLQEYCIKEGLHFPMKKSTLYGNLDKKGLIAAKDTGRHLKTEWIRGAAQKVLKLYRGGISEIGVMGVMNEENS